MEVKLEWYEGVDNSLVFIHTTYKTENTDSTSDLFWLARAIAAEQKMPPTLGESATCGQCESQKKESL